MSENQIQLIDYIASGKLEYDRLNGFTLTDILNRFNLSVREYEEALEEVQQYV